MKTKFFQFSFLIIIVSLNQTMAATAGLTRQPKSPVSTPSLSGQLSNMETCFSPYEGCDQKLIALINSAQHSLDIAIYTISNAGIANVIVSAKNRGVNIRMVVDRSQSVGVHSETGMLSNSNVPLKIGNVTGIMHDKYTIVDGEMMETGSFNYSDNATSNNAENQIYMTDKNVITRYQTNFEKLWTEGLAK